MKKIILCLILGVLLVGLELVVAIPSPAPIYCENMGYTYNNTHCIFSDNEICELWDFYNGECGQEYVKVLDCVESGGSLDPGYECCEGLVSISLSQYGGPGLCSVMQGAWPFCAPCGDGVCDEIENQCNCAEDCNCNSDNLNLCTGQNECTNAGGFWYNDACNEEEPEEEDEEDNETGNQGLGQVIRNRVKTGIYTSPAGEQIRVRELAQNRFLLQVNNISADCECELEEETENNKTKLKVKLSSGRKAEIKIMPDVASERALERLRLKVCSAENNCTIELKEVGSGNKTQLAYELQAERHSKLLWIFRKKMQVRAQIDAETGDIRVKKPWWAFLASEPTEET